MSYASELIARIEKMTEDCQVIALVNHADFLFRSGLVEIPESEWPLLSAAIAKFKSKNHFPISPKMSWRVCLKSGKNLTMRIDYDCCYSEALEIAEQRFFDDVLILE